MEQNSFFPEWVYRLPEADIPFEGFRGWLFQGQQGQILFIEIQPTATELPHSHPEGNQAMIMLDGEMTFFVDDVPQHCKRGDHCYAPAGTMHYAIPHTVVRFIEYFDFDRIKAKSP